MSLTIDYIAMPTKSQEVSHIQAAEQTKLNNEQQQVHDIPAGSKA